jgi:hypothetical protein
MMLTDEKILYLTHQLLKALLEKKLIEPIEEESKIRTEMKRAIISELKIGEEIDSIARKKLQSFSRNIIEGSPEWEVLYRKFFKEEEIKRGRKSG